jgi:hypothetical protein
MNPFPGVNRFLPGEKEAVAWRGDGLTVLLMSAMTCHMIV